MSYFVGMNKFGHHASACLVTRSRGNDSCEIFLKERLTRVRADRGAIEGPLFEIAEQVNSESASFCENSYLEEPLHYEERANHFYPYFERLKSLKLERTTRKFNPSIRFLGHHRCHATAALSVSPFRKSLIVVFDGTGSLHSTFSKGDPEASLVSRFKSEGPALKDGALARVSSTLSESLTVYTQDGAALTPVYKYWQLFDHNQSRRGVAHDGELLYGLGAFYCTISKYIFGDTQEGGKVMGLAPFGRPLPVKNRLEFIRGLDWRKAFVKPERGAKELWQSSKHRKLYADLAATAQGEFERETLALMRFLRAQFPQYENVVLTGGCALNCVTNWKIVEAGIFKNVYVPPFPGDESVSLGAARHLVYSRHPGDWKPVPMDEQSSFFGPRKSAPENHDLETLFAGFEVLKPNDICAFAARELARGNVIGWFQGRSESGPRALGNRSLLANPLIRGMKDRLNSRVKRREAFRPYAPSVTLERAHEYFAVPEGFESPFMSFAPPVRPRYRKRLAEIAHVDHTARLQTVRREGNPRYHRLIESFGKLTGVYCVLNTSLNVMGEAIVETPADAKRFLETSDIDGLAIGDYFIRKIAPLKTETREMRGTSARARRRR
ncbi:MAG TPA: carbamoyltransferase C-terminal domain-containing protein [Bdellovibrionales bacterium]|nr:carbamoyltransferase C-terminal domain-containing protein [Bdellovibrionales bacterium]